MKIPTGVNNEIKYLLEASGFVYNDSLKFEAVHCQPQKGYSLQQNGFYQTYLTSDDVGYCRVTIFPKGDFKYSCKLQKNILWIQISKLKSGDLKTIQFWIQFFV